MATHWSSQNVVAEHKDLQATAMAVNHSGTVAVLAGRRLLALVDLNEPNHVQRKSTRGSGSKSANKFDVKAVEWNPTYELHNYLALAAGNDCEVHVMSETGRLLPDCQLHTQSRSISDLNWHRTDAHLLATASVESYLYLWDVREPRRPMSTLPATSGATQVKWNRKNSHLLASGHETDLRIWDSRKPDQPVLFLPAHVSKVNSIDWSPHSATQIVSASQDCSVRFFDILAPRRPHTCVNTKHPVWRAKYTPFGSGVVSVLVPQLVRGENSLLLWAVEDPGAPVHSFVGHTDIVTNFDWRGQDPQPGGDFQLVSWGRDRCLRMWRLDPTMQALCGPRDPPTDGAVGDMGDSGTAGDDDIHSSSSSGGGVMGASKIKQEAVDPLTPTDNGDPVDAIGEDGSARGAASPVSTTPASASGVHIKTEPSIHHFLEPRLESQESSASTRLVSSSSCTSSPSSAGSSVNTKLAKGDNLSSNGSSYAENNAATSATATAAFDEDIDIKTKLMTFKEELSALRSAAWTDVALANVEVTWESTKRQLHAVCAIAGGGGDRGRAGVTITIHRGYPDNRPLHVTLMTLTTLSNAGARTLVRSMQEVADQHAAAGRNCLLPLVTALIGGSQSVPTDGPPHPEDADDEDIYHPGRLPCYGSFQDHSVPFPRTSGARFCGNGVLVCFTRPTFISDSQLKNSAAVHQTPRSLSALGAYIGSFRPYSALPPAPGIGVGKMAAVSNKMAPDTTNTPYHSMASYGNESNGINVDVIDSVGVKQQQHQQRKHTSGLGTKQGLIVGGGHNQLRRSSHHITEGSITTSPGRYGGSLDRPWKVSQEEPGQSHKLRSLQDLQQSGGEEPYSATSSRTAPPYDNFMVSEAEEGGGDVSISKYYYQDVSSTKRRSKHRCNVKVGEVLVYSVEKLLPLCRVLAQQYRLYSGDVVATCLHNRQVALANDRQDLVQVWSLASRVVQLPPTAPPSDSVLSKGLDPPWALHAFCRPLISMMISHFIEVGDIQTSAMLSCVFSHPTQQQQQPLQQHQQQHQQHHHLQQQQQLQQEQQQRNSRRTQASHQSGGSNYNTIHGLNMKQEEAALEQCPLVVRHNRSNSEGSLPEAARSPHDGHGVPSLTPHCVTPTSPSKTVVNSFVCGGLEQQYEEVRRAYCNVLYNWQLLRHRAEIQQYSSPGVLKDTEFLSECGRCKQLLRSHYCPNCRKPAVKCAICLMPVKGQSVFCLWCGHGGHTTHLLDWFTSNTACPHGCGCRCLDYFTQQ